MIVPHVIFWSTWREKSKSVQWLKTPLGHLKDNFFKTLILV